MLEDPAARALLATIPIDAADRVASLLLRVPPLTDAIDVSTATDVERYMRGLHDRLGGRMFGDEHDARVFREPERRHDGILVVGESDSGNDIRRTVGALTITEHEQTEYPSLAHVVLGVCLDRAELRALAADPSDWKPDPSKHREPGALPVVPYPIAVVTKSHLGEGILLATSALAAAALAAIIVPAIVVQLHVGLVLCFVIACGLAFVLAHRAVYCLWHAPRVKRLAIDAHGFRSPRDGARVAWEQVRAFELVRNELVLALPDGTRVGVPWEQFLDRRAAVAFLRDHVGKERAPYRGR